MYDLSLVVSVLAYYYSKQTLCVRCIPASCRHFTGTQNTPLQCAHEARCGHVSQFFVDAVVLGQLVWIVDYVRFQGRGEVLRPSVDVILLTNAAKLGRKGLAVTDRSGTYEL